jgi:hypothetical protein
MSVKKYLTLNGLTYFLNKIKTYLTSSTYLNSIGISNSDIDDIADDAGYSSGSLPASEDIYITGDIIPNTDNSVDLGASSKNIKMIYTKGITINGTQFLPSNFVNVSGDQTIGGSKYFTSLLSKSNTLARGSLPTTNINEDPIFIAADKNNKRTLAFFNYYNTNGDGRVVLYAYNQNTTNYDNVGLVFGFDNTNNSKSIHPVITNACNLGTSTNKWKTFNGVNPSALSLPSTTGLIDIASSITALDGTTINTFTPQVNGWLLINGSGPVNDGFIYARQGRIGASSTTNQTWYRCVILLPVVAGVEVSVTCKLNTVTWANIVPCQGNV